MTRKNIFSVRNANARHFRLVHRPVGEEGENGAVLKFEDMFEEYDPHGIRGRLAKRLNADTEIVEATEYYEDGQDEEMVDLDDLDAEFDKYAEFIDIEGESDGEHVKLVPNEEKVGEAAKYGILFDDRSYDYTKHLRSVGVTPGAVLINAPGSAGVKASTQKPSKNVDFFSPASANTTTSTTASVEEEFIDPVLIEANKRAREEYRALLEKASNDPTLKEVLEALEDDRYCVEEVDDDLVLSLDQMNLNDFVKEEEEIDIIGDDDEDIDIVAEEEIDITGDDEFDQVLREYDSFDEDESDEGYPTNLVNSSLNVNDFSDSDEIQELNEEEAAEVLNFLRESGRARGTQLYEKRRAPHLPPLHIAIAQYDEVRRDLSVNRDFILERYGNKDEESIQQEEALADKELEGMFAVYDRKEAELKDMNIETAKWYISQTAPVAAAPQVIVEAKMKPAKSKTNASTMPSKSEHKRVDQEKVNKGQARAADETPEEKKARKAQIKAEKREKRTIKSRK